MSKRLYYQDAYQTKFQARVVERLQHNGNVAVVLDQTCFYPVSGGQPADQGFLDQTPVIDVFIRASDDVVVHVLGDELWSDQVMGSIHWERRLDHMQQHTGQHILSAAFLRTAEAETVGFHLSAQALTIDLDRTDLTSVAIEQAELLANRIIWENRAVKIHLVTREQAEGMPLRKVPEGHEQEMRLIEIGRFDLTACGGTHVSATGAVGVIKITGLERRGDQLRVSFVCGGRALQDYRQKNRIINRLAADFTTGYWELESVVDKLREQLQDSQRQLKRQQQDLVVYEAQTLLDQATPKGQIRVVSAAFTGRDLAELRLLANALVETPGVVALLGNGGGKSGLIFARSESAPGQMNELLKPALQMLQGGGGGSPAFAQGGGPAATREQVAQVLARVEKLLLGQI